MVSWVQENEEMGDGEDWVCFDVEKEYGGEEDDILCPYRPKKSMEKTDTGEGGRQAAKGQTCFRRLDRAGCMADASQLATDRER